MGCPSSMSDGDFFYMLADGLSMMVQYGHKSELCTNITRAQDECSHGGAWHCHRKTSEHIMENAAYLLKWFWGPTFGTSCFYDTSCLKDPNRYEVGATDR